MDNNIKLIIELLLKNKSELDVVISSLKEKHGIDIDTKDADAAMAELSKTSKTAGNTIEHFEKEIKELETSLKKTEIGTEKYNQTVKELAEKKKNLTKITDNLKNSQDSAASKNTNFAQTVTAISTAYSALTQVIGHVRQALAKVVELKNFARDAEETGNKFNTVFDSIRYKADQAAESLALSFGMASSTAKELLGDTGDILVGFGFTEESALDLSRQVNELSVDLASFTNFEGGAAGASKALTKAILGETESAKALGLVLRQGTSEFKQQVEVLQKTENMSYNQAMATILLRDAYKQSGKAIGDFARTQNDLANQERILEEVTKNLKEEIGAKLVPIFSKATGEAINFFRSLTETSLEGTIRELKVLGEGTLDLELALAKVTEAKAKYEAIGLDDEETITKNLEESTQRRVELLKNLGGIQAELVTNEGKSEEYYRNIVRLHEAAGTAGDYVVDNSYIEAVQKLKVIDSLNEQLELEGEHGKELLQNLTLLQKAEQSHNRVEAIQNAINETTEEGTKKTVNGIRVISDELQALVDKVPKIKIKMDVDKLDTSDDDDDAQFEAEMAAQAAHLEEMIGMKMEFADRGNELNLTTYELQMLAIDEFYASKKNILIESGLSEEEITLQSEQAKDRIRLQYAQRAASGMKGMFNNLGKVMKSQGKSGFETWKKMAQAQALIDTYKAANSAYASLAGIPIIGPVLGAVAAGAAIAAGYVNVKQIQKQKFAKGGVVFEDGMYESLKKMPISSIGSGIAAHNIFKKSSFVQEKDYQIPKASAGTVLSGNKHSQGGIIVEAEDEEIILTAGVYKDPQLRAIANYLNIQGGGNPLQGASSGAKLAGGGVPAGGSKIEELLADNLAELKALNLNIVKQDITFNVVIETADPEATVKIIKETENRMTEANDNVN